MDRGQTEAAVRMGKITAGLKLLVFAKFKISNFFWHLHGDLNLDEIKNALRLLSVNGEMNLMNLISL